MPGISVESKRLLSAFIWGDAGSCFGAARQEAEPAACCRLPLHPRAAGSPGVFRLSLSLAYATVRFWGFSASPQELLGAFNTR